MKRLSSKKPPEENAKSAPRTVSKFSISTESPPSWALAILEDAADAILTIDEKGLIQWINAAAQKLFGYRAEELVGKNVKTLMPPPYEEQHDQYLANYVRSGEKKIIGMGREVTGRRKDGSIFPLYLSVCESIFAGRRIFGGIARDLTDRKAQEEELRRERDFTRKILDTAETIILLLDRNGRILLYNSYMERLTGQALADVRDRDWFEAFVPQNARRRARWLFKQAMEGRSIRGNVYPIVVRDGSMREVEWFESVMDSDSRGLLCVGLDVTERLEAEENRYAYEEKLRLLTAELIDSEERERKELATILHDEIGQTLALARIKLGALGEEAPDSLRTSITQVDELVRQAVQSSRSLVAELGSTILHELGLEAALAALAEESQQRHGIPCTFIDDHQAKPTTAQTRITLYRGARELIMNVVKHARATRIELAVQRTSASICVSVRDDGDGFNVPAEGFRVSQEGGFGLFSIQERLAHLGGELSVTSSIGAGTLVALEVPIPAPNDSRLGEGT